MFQKLFHKLTEKGFKEFDQFVRSINSIKNGDILLIDSYYNAFSPNLVNYANTQPDAIKGGLLAVNEAGVKLRSSHKQAFEPLSNLANDVVELQRLEAEINKWRESYKKSQELAQKSFLALKKAEENNKRAKITQKQAEINKTEAALSVAQRKYDDDLRSSEDQKASLAEKEKPYKPAFLEAYTVPILAAIDLRIKESERIGELSSEFAALVEQFNDIEADPEIDGLREELEEFNQYVIE